MSNTVNVAFEQEFSDTFIHLAAQKPSKFGSAVRNEIVNDAKAFHFDRMDGMTMQRATSRHEDTPLTEVPFSRRRVTFDTYRGADLIDSADRVKMAKDPTSPTMKQILWSLNRTKDDIIIDAARGNAVAIDADDATSNVALPSAQKVAVGSTDLSLVKIINARKILLNADVDVHEEPIYFAIGPDQLEALLNDSTITSADYNSVRMLMGGDIDTFMGFKWIISTRLIKSGTTRFCLAWAQSGLGLAMNGSPNTRMTERADKNYSMQVYLEASLGAVRIEDEKVVEIACNESA